MYLPASATHISPLLHCWVSFPSSHLSVHRVRFPSCHQSEHWVRFPSSHLNVHRVRFPSSHLSVYWVRFPSSHLSVHRVRFPSSHLSVHRVRLPSSHLSVHRVRLPSSHLSVHRDRLLAWQHSCASTDWYRPPACLATQLCIHRLLQAACLPGNTVVHPQTATGRLLARCLSECVTPGTSLTAV
jgi:hypothetical protein